MRLFESKNLLRNFPPSRRYLVAVSAGRDSVALLHLLFDLGYGKLVVCHLNHEMRGRASDADARFVEKLARKHDLAVEIGSTNVRALAAKKKMSLEAAARSARYSFFAKVARRRQCRTILLAHHADDLVETFLINLFRGAGISGLSGMRERSTRRVDSVDLTIVRPLLAVWRTDIDKYVSGRRLKFREDASNRDLVPLRNRIRRRVIPYLEKTLDRNIRQSIWRAATIAAEEEALLNQMAKNPSTPKSDLSVAELRALPLPLQRRTILKWLHAQNTADIGFDVVERVRTLLDGNPRVAKINLPKNRHVRRREKKIFIEG